ncbi:MAG: penicillin-binding protein 2 [Anaerolineae bacterium]|nr:penicillin-binding protein 2 [Anaerolineae bacterium]
MGLPVQDVEGLEPTHSGPLRREEQAERLDRRQIARRLRAVVGILVLLGVAVAVQLVRWQALSPKPLLVESVAAAQEPVLRGSILDRDGYPLAMDVMLWRVAACPREIPLGQEEETARILAGLTGVPQDRILARLRDKGQPWLYLALGQSHQVRQAILEHQEKGELRGIHLEPQLVRYYPEGASTAHVVGFVTAGARREAFYGVEGYYDDLLTGRDSRLASLGTVAPLDLPEAARPFVPSGAACDLVLTLDRDIQAVAIEELQVGIEAVGAEGGTVVVMDPKTGEILALFSWPTFDPANYAQYAGNTQYEGLLIDPAVSKPYEPGSVLKILTMAAGLDSGVITPETTYLDTGCAEYGQRTICNSGDRAAGWVDMYQVLPQSLNLGAAFISDRLGPDLFYAYLARFGLGAFTEVDLEGESPGKVRRPGDPLWSKVDLATHAYGQGIQVTPVQLASAVAAVANRGLLMRPHVVSKLVLPEGMVEIAPVPVRQVIQPETAEILTDMLVRTVEEGVTQAKVPGYTVAGKTGTADIPTREGYTGGGVIASFVGFAPADEPRFVVLVKVDRPSGPEGWGMYVAAPIFSRIVERLLVHAGIPPNDVRHNLEMEYQSRMERGSAPRGGEG